MCGLFGYNSSTTEVNLVVPIDLKLIVTQNMSTKGFGLMSGFGLGPDWVSVISYGMDKRPEQ
jgi:hypothetical protein